jgi:transposase
LPHRTHRGKAGHPFNDHRRIINGLLWILHTGAPWRDLPERYGPWETVYYRFNRWRYDGTWVRIVTAMLDKLDDLGKLDHDLWCIDGTIIRASRAAAGARRMSRRPRILGGRKEVRLREPSDHALGRSRGGFGTKIHLVCDSRGNVVGIHITAGQAHESRAFEPTMGPAVVPLPSWPPTVASVAGRRQGLQLPEDPALVPEAEGQTGNPDQEESAPEGGLRQGDV